MSQSVPFIQRHTLIFAVESTDQDSTMQVKVVKPGKKGAKDFGAIDVADSASVADLKRAFEKATRISRHRQNFKLVNAAGALVVRASI